MANQLDTGAQKLLDQSKPTDIDLLDQTVATFYTAPSAEQRKAAETILRRFQEPADAWLRVDSIIEQSKSQQTKYFALQILEELIKYRWATLPREQTEGIKAYVSNLVIKISADEASFRREKTFLNKLNVILVQILKQEWPHKWQKFIPDLVNASKTSETLCENSMVILKLLSEEVFDFSKDVLTQAKTSELKQSLNTEFTLIHELCSFVLTASQKPDLIRATLETLSVYLSWVPLGYILESNMIQVLLKLFPQPPYRNVTLRCLTEVAGLTVGEEHNSHFVSMYVIFIQQLQVILPQWGAIPSAYEQGSDEEQGFIQNLALFFTAFFKAHLQILEKHSEQPLLTGMDCLLHISFVPDEEIFKICLDYWHHFVPVIYSGVKVSSAYTNGVFHWHGANVLENSQKRLYSAVLSKLRLLMITRMAKPEEVIVVEDENGNIVRETMKDTDTLARYKTMHETLVYLSHLDHEDTEEQMLTKLQLQLTGKEWSWSSLNTLCWAIGSISGSMAEEQENRFLVSVIRDLLNLCEMTRGKDNKAVIAANIMYVVGQYPVFLRNHWKFLKTVVNKLFEFMHELHPGVQDMACETFLKICHKCKRKFVVQQIGEQEPFISVLLKGLQETIQDLQLHQIHMFYEAVGLMISSDADPTRRNAYLEQLMGPPNTLWQTIIAEAAARPEVLKESETIKNVQTIVQTNVSVCTSLGTAFVAQMSKIFTDLLSFYRMYSELISAAIANGGPHASRSSQVKLMRSCKKVALKLIQTFVEKCDDSRLLSQDMIPAMLNPILGDYARNVPDARDAEVLSLFAAIINKLKDKMQKDVPAIFEAVFECTLTMITKNFEDYPEHRLQFFALLRAITNEVPTTLFQMSPEQLKLVIDSIVWAFRHTERNVAETGLKLLLEMLIIFDKSNVATQFYQQYYLQLVREIFAVMTDTFHKPGLKMHSRILFHLIAVVKGNVIREPLSDAAGSQAADNVTFVKQQMTQLLVASFPNMQAAQIESAVQAMFECSEAQQFKPLLRDFLVQTKAFASQDNSVLFADEHAQNVEAARLQMSSIPGMLHPHETAGEDMGD